MSNHKIDYYEFTSKSNIGDILLFMTEQFNPPKSPNSKYIILCDLDGVILSEDPTNVTIRNKLDSTITRLKKAISNDNCKGFYIFTLRGANKDAVAYILDQLIAVGLYKILKEKYDENPAILKIPDTKYVIKYEFVISMEGVYKVKVINLLLEYNNNLIIDYFFFIDNSLSNILQSVIYFKPRKLQFKTVGIKLGYFCNPDDPDQIVTRTSNISKVINIQKEVKMTIENECML